MCSGFTSMNIFEYKSKVLKDFIGLEEKQENSKYQIRFF